MAIVYVDPECVKDSMDYFISQEYTSPEQIGLFFLFKADKFNSREYQTYDATGAQKARLTRYLYDLCALFNAKQENGGKYESLFPFSMDPRMYEGIMNVFFKVNGLSVICLCRKSLLSHFCI